jgi:hypothetical protein
MAIGMDLESFSLSLSPKITYFLTILNPICHNSRNYEKGKYFFSGSSGAGESRPHTLTDIDVNLSAHPVPIICNIACHNKNSQDVSLVADMI